MTPFTSACWTVNWFLMLSRLTTVPSNFSDFSAVAGKARTKRMMLRSKYFTENLLETEMSRASEGGANQMRNVAKSVCSPISRSQRIAPSVMKLRRAAGEQAIKGDDSLSIDIENGAVSS